MAVFFRFTQYFIAFFIFGLAFWLEKKYGNVTLDQLVFHFTYMKEGGRLNFDTYFAFSFLKLLVLILFFSTCSILFERCCDRTNNIIFRFIPLLAILVGLLYCAYTFSFFKYIQFEDEDFFKDNYIDPVHVLLKKDSPKNLILIYVEGFENTYSNKSLFGKDLLVKVRENEGQSFGAYEQVSEGVGWTIAAIVSTQCAAPLKILSLYNGNSQGEFVRSFMPNAICLGDTLLNHGYKNVFMGGASLSFSGKEAFLRGHGYNELWGREEWLSVGRYNESEMNGWGLQDDDLFAEARKKLDNLESQSDLFNLTLLTVNTHHPEGFYSKKCLSLGARKFDDIVACTSHDLSDFVSYIKARGYLSNSRVVIIGDHLAMKNAAYEQLSQINNRTIFNYWISEDPVLKNREQIVHFDIAPSILDYIGLKVQGGRYGLGYSGFTNEEINITSNRVENFNKNLKFQSKEYNKLWY
jgi:phosphoglycerol transferase